MICLFTCARTGAKAVCRICGKCPHLCKNCERLRRPSTRKLGSFPTSIPHRFFAK